MDNLYGDEFVNVIKYYLPEAKVVSGGSHLLVRCRFCGDSSDPKHAHMYISIPKSSEDLSLFDCKKCPASGVVNDEFLRKYDVLDSNLLVQINSHNNRIMNTPKYKMLRTNQIYPLNNTYIRNDKSNQAKLNYINTRIGSNFSMEDMVKLKIVLNLYDLINNNNLGITRDKRITDAFDLFFIGFISYDNTCINMRKVFDVELHESISDRYMNYNIIDKKIVANRRQQYVIPTSVDIMNPEPVKIHIAEGPFDILSVFYNLNNCNTNQNIYISNGGKSYLNSLNMILKETGVINFEVHYYPDRDVKTKEIDDIVRETSKLGCPICIHRNMFDGEKDFGVPMNRVIDNVMFIMYQ